MSCDVIFRRAIASYEVCADLACWNYLLQDRDPSHFTISKVLYTKPSWIPNTVLTADEMWRLSDGSLFKDGIVTLFQPHTA